MGKGLVFIIAGYSFEKIKNIKIILEENIREDLYDPELEIS